MSKSGNGDILGLDPAAVDAALGLAPIDQFIPSGAGMAGATTVPTAGADGMQYGLTVMPTDGGVGMAGPDEILPAPDQMQPAPDQMQPAPAISPIQQFYGSSNRITQPDAGYYDEFLLPGTQTTTTTTTEEPAIPIFEPTPMPVDPDLPTDQSQPYDPYIDILRDFTSNYVQKQNLPDYTPFDSNQVDNYLSGVDFTNYVNPVDTSGFLTADDLPDYTPFDSNQVDNYLSGVDFSNYVDTSDYLTSADLPDYTPFDSNQVDNYLSGVDFSNYVDTVPAIDTSNFLTSADLPAQIDTSNFLTAADLPAAVDTSNFLTAADLPTFDTSNFLTAADLPAFDTSQFLTAADLPAQIDTSNFLTAADLPTQIDTSSFLTADDLPNYQQFDSSALEKEIAALKAQIGLLGQAPTRSFAQTQASIPILDFSVR